jgi:nucleoside-diphosphate-sugar epimerase
MKILIVGSSGFVGRNFLDYLAIHREVEVYTLDREKKESAGVLSFDWQNMNQIPFSQVSKIFYLTGKAHDLKNASDRQAYFDINVGLLTQFLKQSSLGGFIGQLVYLSSVKAIADTVEGVLTEQQKPNPKTDYGKSKLEAEKIILASNYAENAIILRPCMIHGKGNKGNLNVLYSFVKKGIPNILVKFKNERSLLNIDNLIFVFDEIIHNRLPADSYQIADNAYISTNEMMGVIGEAINKKVVPIAIPIVLIDFLARIGDFLPLPLNSDRLQKLTENYKVSNQKISAALGKELPISLRQGLKNTVKSFE